MKKSITDDIWDRIVKLHDSKKKPGIIKMSHDGETYYYRRLCVNKNNEKVSILDTSTDLYRPITQKESQKLSEIGIEEFCDELFINSCVESIETNRSRMQIAIAKKNMKDIEYHHKKALNALNILRDFLDYPQK